MWPSASGRSGPVRWSGVGAPDRPGAGDGAGIRCLRHRLAHSRLRPTECLRRGRLCPHAAAVWLRGGLRLHQFYCATSIGYATAHAGKDDQHHALADPVAGGPGALLGGWLGEHYGLRVSLMFAGTTALLLMAAAWRVPAIRRVRTLPVLKAEAIAPYSSEAEPEAMADGPDGRSGVQ